MNYKTQALLDAARALLRLINSSDSTDMLRIMRGYLCDEPEFQALATAVARFDAPDSSETVTVTLTKEDEYWIAGAAGSHEQYTGFWYGYGETKSEALRDLAKGLESQCPVPFRTSCNLQCVAANEFTSSKFSGTLQYVCDAQPGEVYRASMILSRDTGRTVLPETQVLSLIKLEAGDPLLELGQYLAAHPEVVAEIFSDGDSHD
jgi:hypothetical protein